MSSYVYLLPKSLSPTSSSRSDADLIRHLVGAFRSTGGHSGGWHWRGGGEGSPLPPLPTDYRPGWAGRPPSGPGMVWRYFLPVSRLHSISSPERFPSMRCPMNCNAYPATNNVSAIHHCRSINRSGAAAKQAGMPAMCSQKLAGLRCLFRQSATRRAIGLLIHSSLPGSMYARGLLQLTKQMPHSEHCLALKTGAKHSTEVRHLNHEKLYNTILMP